MKINVVLRLRKIKKQIQLIDQIVWLGYCSPCNLLITMWKQISLTQQSDGHSCHDRYFLQ